MNKSISAGLTARSKVSIVALAVAALFVTRLALSHDGRNGEFMERTSSNSNSATHEPSQSEVIGRDMANVQLYRERIAAEKAALEKKERELSEKASTRPGDQAIKEMDEAPLAFKGLKEDPIKEKAVEMVDTETTKQLESVREQIVAKEKELKAADSNLAYHRDMQNRARNAEQKQNAERTRQADIERRTRDNVEKYNKELRAGFDRMKTG